MCGAHRLHHAVGIGGAVSRLGRLPQM